MTDTPQPDLSGGYGTTPPLTPVDDRPDAYPAGWTVPDRKPAVYDR